MPSIFELLEQLPLEDLEGVDATCDAFVSARRRGETPRIEDILAATPESPQLLTALELVRTEIELRREAGERPTAVEYVSRFPQWSSELQSMIAELLGAAADTALRSTMILYLQDTVPRSVFPPMAPDASPTWLTQVSSRNDEPPHNTRLGNYEIREVLGRGGMGIVVRAREMKLERDVAIKLLTPELARNESAKERFEREARAMAGVRHDNVVTIHTVDEANGIPFLVMELIVGETLGERLKREGPLPAAEVARLGIQMALGLEAAHRRGLIHRDIKPANILLEGGSALLPVSSATDGQECPSSNQLPRVKITDFGLASVAAEASITQSGLIAGTPQYMSPEQVNGQPLDHRSDLFSLGSVLYALCTGRAPFQAETAIVVLRKVADHDPKPIQTVNPAIPDWLCEIISRLMAKQPEDRIQTAAEVAELLRRNLAEQQVRTRGTLARPAVKRRARVPLLQRGILTALLGVGVLIALAAVVVTRPQWAGFAIRDSEPLPHSPVEISATHQVTEVTDAPPVNPLLSADFEWSALEDLGEPINTPGYEAGASISADGLSLLFHGNAGRAQQTGKLQLWQAWRHTVNEPFQTPVLLDGVINDQPERLSDPTLTADGLTLAFCMSRDDGHGGFDLWIADRPSGDASWNTVVNAGAAVNSGRDEWEPELSADGLTLLFHSNRANENGGTDLWLARRDSRDKSFGVAENLGHDINTSGHEGGAALSSDGRTLLFHCLSADASASLTHWQASRKSVSDPFGAPQPLLVPGLFENRGTSLSLSSAGDWLHCTTSRAGESPNIAVSRRIRKGG